jgi:hypothetical protein
MQILLVLIHRCQRIGENLRVGISPPWGVELDSVPGHVRLAAPRLRLAGEKTCPPQAAVALAEGNQLLAVSEIRLFGASSLQVPRRLHAMLEHLLAILPEARTPALRQELALLHSVVERVYVEGEDRRRAATGDRQGIGSSSLLRT